MGPPLSLKCTALGHPPPVITWTLDGRPLTPSADHYGRQRVSMGSWVDPAGQVVSQVNVSRITHLDDGQYTCTASNAAGSTSHTAPINVNGTCTCLAENTRQTRPVSVAAESCESVMDAACVFMCLSLAPLQVRPPPAAPPT